MSHRNTAQRQSLMIAFCGMTVGLSVAIMLLGGVIPVATFAVPLLCGLLLLPLYVEFGKAAWAAFFATALLALLLDFDKEAAFFYLFVGYYPLVKWKLDRIKGKGLRIGLKILLFAAAVFLMYGLLFLLFPLTALIQEYQEMGVWMTALSLVLYESSMLLYDWMLLLLMGLYVRRVRPRLPFLRK